MLLKAEGEVLRSESLHPISAGRLAFAACRALWLPLLFGAILCPASESVRFASEILAPKEYQKGTGSFIVPSILEIKATKGLQERLSLLGDRLEGTDVSLRVSSLKEGGLEVLVVGRLDYESRKLEVPPRPEGYLLDVRPEGILLLARDTLGAQWGLYRLALALDPKTKRIPCFTVRDWPDMPWRAVHIMLPAEKELPRFRKFVDEVLLPLHFNTVVVEVNYDFPYRSHPEVSDTDARSRQFCSSLRDITASRGLRLIVEFNCLGHQSWGKTRGGLLRSHPEFDETPWLKDEDKRLYCRSWCPRHPDLPPLLFDLWSELAETFRPAAFHMGMDEVFLIAEKDCPRCAGSTPGEIFYAAASQYYAFFRGTGRKVLMWGDRLLERKRFEYSKYESSETDTWKALRFLPRDIIICDWHYGVRASYPSIPYFLEQGFRVLACPWRDPKNVRALWEYAQKVRTDRFLGFLATTWVSFSDLADALFAGKGSEKAQGAAQCLKLVGRLCWQGKKEQTSS